jgi:hypothetical protein
LPAELLGLLGALRAARVAVASGGGQGAAPDPV